METSNLIIGRKREKDINPAYLKSVIERMEDFRADTKTNKALHLTFVTINGLKHNAQYGMFQNEVTADDLFRQ